MHKKNSAVQSDNSKCRPLIVRPLNPPQGDFRIQKGPLGPFLTPPAGDLGGVAFEITLNAAPMDMSPNPRFSSFNNF